MNAPDPIPRPAALDAWRRRCREQGFDPEEVVMVADRYRAYRDYMAGRGGALALEAWFRFYRMEKDSETGAQGGAVSGCTATGEANAQNCLTSPGPFLELLREHLALKAA